MATISEIRESIKTRLEEIAGLEVYDYMPSGSPATPAALIGFPTSIDYQVTAGAFMGIELEIMLIVGKHSSKEAAKKLDGFCDYGSATSIRNAVLDSSIAVTANWHETSLFCREAKDFGRVTIAGTDYLAGIWTVGMISP